MHLASPRQDEPLDCRSGICKIRNQEYMCSFSSKKSIRTQEIGEVNPALRILCLSLLVWTLRLAHEAVVSLPSTLDFLWLVLTRPLALAATGFFIANHYISLCETYTGRKFWLWSFISGAILCLPYFPDMYASFLKAGENNALSLAIAFFVLGILTYGGIRGLMSQAIKSLFLKKRHSRFRRAATLYFLFLVSEFLFFHSWHPITYFPALPLPLPSSALHLKTNENESQQPLETILLQTYIDQTMRLNIERGNFLALSIFGEDLAKTISEQTRTKKMNSELVIILPETLVSLESPSDASLLAKPVFQALNKMHGVKKIAWIQGAFLNNSNVVLGWQVSDEHQVNQKYDLENPVRILRVKKEHMPMFEAPSKGITYSQSPSKVNFIEETPSEGQDLLKRFVQENRILICYESLFPSNWNFFKRNIVLTNHHLFTEFNLMNWVYLGFIRQLSFIFHAPAFLVSNYNPSGALKPQQLPIISSFLPALSNWFVVSYAQNEKRHYDYLPSY